MRNTMTFITNVWKSKLCFSIKFVTINRLFVLFKINIAGVSPPEQ